MLARLATRARPDRAVAVLREVFGTLGPPFAFRLWDGTEVALGSGAPPFTVVVKSPETLVRLMRDPSPLNFAEAYVESALDIEGDLFAAMTVADHIETLSIPLPRRLRLMASLLAP
jgi:cyclopropane-fatty-acyl-phospholipid synthase